MNSPSSASDQAPTPPCAFPADSARWFREELQPHDAAVRGYLQRRYPGVDPDDVMQESYIKLLRAKATGQIRSTKAYFFTTVRNTVLSLLRKRKSYTETALSEVSHLRVYDDGPDAAEVAEAGHRFEFVKEAIEHLPPRCREVMRMAVLHGRSSEEICLALGIAENTVRAQLAIGLKKCTDYVREHGGHV